MRSEVIKRQSDLLLDLLEYINKNSRTISLDGIDYLELVRLNSFKWADLFGFKFKTPEDLNKYLDEISAHQIIVVTKQLADGVITQPFSEHNIPDEDSLDSIAKDLWYKRGKSGNYEIDRIFLTKRHSSFMEDMRTYTNNPLIPTNVKDVLLEVLNEIDQNIRIHLKYTIETLISELFIRDKKFGFAPEGIYNSFNHVRIHHDKNSIKLRTSIREYLKIDSMP